MVSCFLVGIRDVYAAISVFTQSADLSPNTGSLAIKVCFSVVPEFIVVVLFVLLEFGQLRP